MSNSVILGNLSNKILTSSEQTLSMEDIKAQTLGNERFHEAQLLRIKEIDSILMNEIH